MDETAALETLALFQQMGEIDKEFGDPWEQAATEAGWEPPARWQQ
jgi:hydrogenase expression/formation protein HypC